MTQEEILDILDDAAENFDFQSFHDGYYLHADQKLTLFRDEKRWAILIEQLVSVNSARHTIVLVANVYGNCAFESTLGESVFFLSEDAMSEHKTFLVDNESSVYLNPIIKSIKIRNEFVDVLVDRTKYVEKGVELQYPNKIMCWEFLRGNTPEISKFFWLKKDEIAQKIPADLPKIKTIKSWQHPNLMMEEKPSDTLTFKQIAKVLETGDLSHLKKNELVNTHWKNWMK
jgi:hypothetical protein